MIPTILILTIVMSALYIGIFYLLDNEKRWEDILSGGMSMHMASILACGLTLVPFSSKLSFYGAMVWMASHAILLVAIMFMVMHIYKLEDGEYHEYVEQLWCIR